MEDILNTPKYIKNIITGGGILTDLALSHQLLYFSLSNIVQAVQSCCYRTFKICRGGKKTFTDLNQNISSRFFLTRLVVDSFIIKGWDVKRHNMTAVRLNFSYPEKKIAHNEDMAVASAGCVFIWEESSTCSSQRRCLLYSPGALTNFWLCIHFPSSL